MNNPTLVEQLNSELLPLPTPQTFRFCSLGRSHVGRVRWVNEDAYLEHGESQLWAVADGMGGLNRGDHASKVTLRALQEYQTGATLEACLASLHAIINQAHDTCHKAFRGKRIGTTLALLHIVDSHGLLVWAGDSRIYRLRAGELEQLTIDHNLAEQQRTQGKPPQDGAQTLQSAHVLTRAVGVHREVCPQLCYQSVQASDRFLLCTDGAFKDLDAHEIRAAMMLATPPEVLECVEGLALDRGGHDNTTSLVVDVSSPG
ncbi:PP2C family protein-serine/threonine phosphatase [Halioxenophilus aromaticivorans]|uniref:Serine/threonine phosphatase PppA n=1 Tax=Halioxenophilus aromaticivorans TaxID=1306992 RepID=A0AAV3U5A5_9ALTE